MASKYGAQPLKSWLSKFPIDLSLAWWEAGLLLGSGALAVWLHQVLRLPLGLPGRHGLEWMALLLLGRAASRYRWAGTLASLGAAGTALLPLWRQGDDPFVWLIYLLPGLVIDWLYTARSGWQDKLWFLALLGGLAHATKPLARWVISLLTGWPYGSLVAGLAYPLATHIIFGLAGALIGAGLIAGMRRVEKHFKL